PARDEQFAVDDEPAVTCAEEGAIVTVDTRLERCAALLGLAPITAGDTRTGHPDLADLAARDFGASLRIDDPDVMGIAGLAAPDEIESLLGRPRGVGRDDRPASVRPFLDRADRRRVSHGAARDE